MFATSNAGHCYHRKVSRLLLEKNPIVGPIVQHPITYKSVSFNDCVLSVYNNSD